jgi:hypothetical protein
MMLKRGSWAKSQQCPTSGDESNNVIAALRKGGIAIVEVHNHSLDEQSHLFYLHFWAVDDAVTLAKALRPALDATNVKNPPADISAHRWPRHRKPPRTPRS